jgi:hypothetical protein
MQQAATAPAIIIDRKLRRFMPGMLRVSSLRRKARETLAERPDCPHRRHPPAAFSVEWGKPAWRGTSEPGYSASN